MERCKFCRSDRLEKVEYVETSLFGESVRVVILYCETCGQAVTVSSDTAPVPV